MKKLLLILAICTLSAQAKVRTLQVTLTASATPVIASGDVYFKWVVFQNNATHTIHIGDSLVSATRGIQLLAAGSYTQQPFSPPITGNLNGWFIFGTSGDVIDIVYDDGQ